ncbi:mCG145401, partial [Mus musculus]
TLPRTKSLQSTWRKLLIPQKTELRCNLYRGRELRPHSTATWLSPVNPMTTETSKD